ncbi:unnamed protein product [Clonostachys rosea f. rosea IK726]|uniref:Uncharacterized protein n=1 Tax=Clonostachys rosea f. rosea IK726 TaxID=1349383 RepID=A0ACA9TT28_BIOOC|nr:unnamed protein product [Clonostachys rosea f. rosea IK726]
MIPTEADPVSHATPRSSAAPNTNTPGIPVTPKNRSSTISSVSGSLRRVSLGFQGSKLPDGFSAATGGIASTVFSRQVKQAPNTTGAAQVERIPLTEVDSTPNQKNSGEPSTRGKSPVEPPEAASFPNGYHFPPKHTFAQSTRDGALAFWKYFITPVGFIVTIYGLNIVAWGGMLFLLLCNASPAMCYPTCNDIDSPRRKWIEWDSQILNALFCVTGFGLAPWRFRDLWYILQYRLAKDDTGLRRLAGIHRGWFRLPGSETVPIDFGPKNAETRTSEVAPALLPFPAAAIPDVPLTGVRAPGSQVWKLDLVIWLMVWNTFLQIVLSVFMWHFNRFTRPSWATGLFVALACLVAAAGGYIMFLEGKRVKSIEGVPLSQDDLERLEKDRENGVWHYNNLQDRANFRGQHGKAYLFHTVVNVEAGEANERNMTTGRHVVRDIVCRQCRETVGWKYDKAYESSEKYKEGKFILEAELLCTVT